MLVGVWVNPITYRLTNPDTGRDMTLFIPEAPTMPATQLEEWLEDEKEQAEKELAQPLPSQMTKGQQHDLGGVLLDIRASKRYKGENQHGRYW